MRLSGLGRMLLLGTLAAGCSAPLQIAQAPAPSSPNILLVIVDEMGLDATPGYPIGAEKPRMPTLTRLMQDGLTFDNAWATPECSPTRATILTGRYGFRTGVGASDTGPSLNETGIQRFLDQRVPGRYAHAVIGKWHLATQDNGGYRNPNLMGVGHYSGLLEGGMENYYRWPRTVNGTTREVEGYATTVTTDDAIAWLRLQHTPWFLWLAYSAAHDPYQAPPASLYNRPLPDTAEGNERPFFLASLEAMDQELGRLLASLDATTRENTVIMVLSDNGSAPEVIQSPYTHAQAHQSLYQGGINIPLVISGAGVTRRSERERDLVNSVDLFATIADIAGTGVTSLHDGNSLEPYFSSRTIPGRGFAYSEYFGPSAIRENTGWTIRNARYKLLVLDSGLRQLFDLLNDPFERRNLLADDNDEAHRIAAQLMREGEALRSSAR